jgi:hypothetical protein
MYESYQISLCHFVIDFLNAEEAAGVHAGVIAFEQRGQLSRGLIQVLAFKAGDGLVVVVGLEGQQLVGRMLADLTPDDRDVGWNNILSAAIFFSVLGFSDVSDGGLKCFGLDDQSFLFFAKFVDFPGEADCFSVEFDHDGAANAVIDLAEIIGVYDLFDEVVSLIDCLLGCGFTAAITLDDSFDGLAQYFKFLLCILLCLFLMVDIDDGLVNFLSLIPFEVGNSLFIFHQ